MKKVNQIIPVLAHMLFPINLCACLDPRGDTHLHKDITEEHNYITEVSDDFKGDLSETKSLLEELHRSQKETTKSLSTLSPLEQKIFAIEEQIRNEINNKKNKEKNPKLENEIEGLADIKNSISIISSELEKKLEKNPKLESEIEGLADIKNSISIISSELEKKLEKNSLNPIETEMQNLLAILPMKANAQDIEPLKKSIENIFTQLAKNNVEGEIAQLKASNEALTNSINALRVDLQISMEKTAEEMNAMKAEIKTLGQKHDQVKKLYDSLENLYVKVKNKVNKIESDIDIDEFEKNRNKLPGNPKNQNFNNTFATQESISDEEESF